MQLQLPNPLLSLFLLLGTTAAQVQDVISDSTLSINSVPFSTRAFWMRRANAALAELVSPCPFSAFATAIVNHTAPGLGELVCLGVNSRQTTANPTLHGEHKQILSPRACMLLTLGFRPPHCR